MVHNNGQFKLLFNMRNVACFSVRCFTLEMWHCKNLWRVWDNARTRAWISTGCMRLGVVVTTRSYRSISAPRRRSVISWPGLDCCWFHCRPLHVSSLLLGMVIVSSIVVSLCGYCWVICGVGHGNAVASVGYTDSLFESSCWRFESRASSFTQHLGLCK